MTALLVICDQASGCVASDGSVQPQGTALNRFTGDASAAVGPGLKVIPDDGRPVWPNKPPVPSVRVRLAILEARAPVPGPAGPPGKDGASIVGPQGPAGAVSTVPGPQGPVGPTGPAGTNANLVAATLTTAGVIKANITLVQRTTQPIPVSLPAITAAPAGLVSSISVTVPGVALGDAVTAMFAAVPPTGLTILGAQAMATDRVLVTFAATQLLTLAAGAQSLSFVWTR